MWGYNMRRMRIWAVVLMMLVVTPLTRAETKLEKQLVRASKNAVEINGFIETAAKDHGVLGKKAAVFLVEGMPEHDLKSLDKEFLLGNLDLAIKARQQFPWAKNQSEDIFLNDVLPYASLDETREPWRAEFYRQCQTLVKECKTATAAR
jgi:hypothetical protein